ncbi:MAG: CDP-alcohol phosphatidyltransferase family protein [Planctomycetota bacterium]
MSLPDAYAPSARRPIANVFRRTAHACVRLCVRARIHPNTISLSSIVAAAGAGLCFVQGWIVPAVLLCFLRLWLNMLDGMVALASGQASRWGEILNDLPDRVSDVLIFVGVAHSGLAPPLLGYWAAIASLLVAYVGTFGQAVGAQREFSGWMAKPWRMVALAAGALAGRIDVALVVILAGCVQTVTVRLLRIARALKETP